MEEFKIILFFIINLFGFLLMGYDKRQAKNNGWRVKEKTLLTVALIGGAIGSYLGMHFFRHKTKHELFKTGLPLLVIFNLYLFFNWGQ